LKCAIKRGRGCLIAALKRYLCVFVEQVVGRRQGSEIVQMLACMPRIVTGTIQQILKIMKVMTRLYKAIPKLEEFSVSFQSCVDI
jgi:hypothetical protein